MKKILIALGFLANTVLVAYFGCLSFLNIIYYNSKTVGISVLGYNITADGICFPLHIITILLVIALIFVVVEVKKNLTIKNNYIK